MENMKQLALCISLLTITACTCPNKPGNSYYGRKIRQAYVDGCKSEAAREYGRVGRQDLVELRTKTCELELQDYSQ